MAPTKNAISPFPIRDSTPDRGVCGVRPATPTMQIMTVGSYAGLLRPPVSVHTNHPSGPSRPSGALAAREAAVLLLVALAIGAPRASAQEIGARATTAWHSDADVPATVGAEAWLGHAADGLVFGGGWQRGRRVRDRRFCSGQFYDVTCHVEAADRTVTMRSFSVGYRFAAPLDGHPRWHLFLTPRVGKLWIDSTVRGRETGVGWDDSGSLFRIGTVVELGWRPWPGDPLLLSGALRASRALGEGAELCADCRGTPSFLADGFTDASLSLGASLLFE